MNQRMVFTAVGLVLFGMAGLAAGNSTPAASNPSFYGDVLPILQDNCQLCHRARGANFGGMVAPMALQEYREVRPWAKAIAQQTSARKMPPWSASPEQKGLFRNERTLTQAEIDTLVRWAETGAPRGNPNDAPDPPMFESYDGWQIGEPDLVVDMGERYFVGDDVEDLYIDFTTKLTEEQLPEDRYVKAVEFRAGSSAVHHIIARPIGGMAPGYDPVVHNEGFAHMLKKGATVTWNMHYHKEPGPGTGVWDKSEAAIVFWPKGTVIEHTVQTESLGAFDFNIPAGDPNYHHHASHTFDQDVLVVSMNPHMHLRGKAAKYTAVYPDGRSEVLLHVPQYDFNWQTTYTYAEPKPLPAGTTVHFDAWWDNSADNSYNPDPTRNVRWGRPTTDEMMFGWMRWTPEEPVPVVVGGEAFPERGESDVQTD